MGVQDEQLRAGPSCADRAVRDDVPMRTFAFTAGAATIIAVVLATITNRVLDDIETARSILNFGLAAAATCGGLLYLDKKLQAESDRTDYLDDGTDYRP